MKIYTIKHDENEYDSFLSHAIVANTELEVRCLAKLDPGDEGEEIWDTAKIEEQGEYTGNKTEPFILMSVFRAG